MEVDNIHIHEIKIEESGVVALVISVLGTETGRSQGLLASHLTELISSRFCERLCLKMMMMMVVVVLMMMYRAIEGAT